jgi:hypothetical protein
VLNMLSQYAGYRNWDDFRFKIQGQITHPEKEKSTIRIYLLVPLLFLIVLVIVYIIKFVHLQNYQFTFFDADTKEAIHSSNIRVDLLLDNESPVSYMSDNEGRVKIKTRQRKISMVIKAPYYVPDTVTRILKKFIQAEQIGLNADSYALMIHYFSQTDVNGWERRREQLNRMISDDAMIYQMPDNNGVTAMELYNKGEFIDKLTMPSSNLKQIDILDCRYLHGQIAILRFRIKTGSR